MSCYALFTAATALVEGKIGKSLKKVLKKVVAKEAHEQLAISDAKLGGIIKVSDTASRAPTVGGRWTVYLSRIDLFSFLFFCRKSWTWRACTARRWPSWWGASGARWRASSLDCLPGRWAPCLWVWLTGKPRRRETDRQTDSCLWLHLLSETPPVESFKHSSLPLRQRVFPRRRQQQKNTGLFFGSHFFVLYVSFPHTPSLSRYKLKFSPDKVDTMIVQAICKLCLTEIIVVPNPSILCFFAKKTWSKFMHSSLILIFFRI